MLENKKIGRLSLGKSPRRNQSTTALQSSDGAKVQQNIDICKENLKNLANKWKNVNDVRGFLTDLWSALKMSGDGKGTMGNNPSKYSYFKLPDGTDAIISIRGSAHNADCANYLDKPGSFNLGIVLQRRNKPNTFKAHPDVKAEEYVYTNQRIKSIESPLSQIAYSLIKFLDGEGYTDTTGVAIKHQSPQSEEPQKLEENKQYRNTTTTMKKKQTIKLNESQLRQVIKESVKNILKENMYSEAEQEQLYDYHEIVSALNLVTEYTLETLKSLGKRAIPIMYCINPDSTAIGNNGVSDSDYDSIRMAINRSGLVNDGNRGYTLLDLAKMIDGGEFGDVKHFEYYK